MPVDDAQVSLTQEPSGEVRLRLWVPDRHGGRDKRRPPIAAEGAGCTALVYRLKVREKPKERSGFGRLPSRTVFGSAARRAVKNGCGALKSRFGKRIVFATVTLPGSTASARQAIAEWSAKAVELLTHWLTSTAPGCMYTYVWEHQKSGALHWHCAIGHDDILLLRRLEKTFQEYIHKMFATLTRLSGVDMFARAGGGSWRGCVKVLRSNCVPVRKCVKRYMSKYLTKGEGLVQAHCPSRWWGCSRALRALVGALRLCSRKRISDLAVAVTLGRRCTSLIARLGCKLFGFSPPFSPHSYTWLIYPEEPDVQRVYALLLECLNDVPVVIPRPSEPDGSGIPILRSFEPLPALDTRMNLG